MTERPSMTDNPMTDNQKRLIRESFPAIREVAAPVALLFYGRLFDLNPSLRPLFKQDIAIQGRKLMDMLTAVIDHLDHFEGVVSQLRAMGQRHAGYGVQTEHYPEVAKALVWALGHALDREFYPDVKEAWIFAIEAISEAMLSGVAELPPK